VLLAEQIIVSPGQVPIRFSLEYSRAAIDPRLSYVLRAHITDRGRLFFTTDTHMPVLTRGAGDEAHLLLVQVADVAAPPAAPTIARAAGTPLRGMFRYLADAAWFRDCRTSQAHPVAMEGAYIEAERAYLNSGIEAGTELMIEVDGRYLERPSMENNHNEINLIIDSFNNLLPDNACAQETSRR
jgi:copper homeostasis protein (lipoprotein)